MTRPSSRLLCLACLGVALLSLGCVSERHNVSVSVGDHVHGRDRGDGALAVETAPGAVDYHLICWNAHKAGHEDFSAELRGLLEEIPQQDQIILCLQEVRASTYDLIRKAGGDSVGGHYAESWRYPISKRSTGVMTVTNRSLPPAEANRLRSGSREFLVTSPKVCLRSELVVGDDQRLVVLNCHGLNFVTDRVFKKQFDQVFRSLDPDGGSDINDQSIRSGEDAVIVCGDFNVWSQSRLALLEEKVRAAGLAEANVLGHRTPDLPALVGALTPLFGVDPEIPLDRIYARGIDIVECRSIEGMESSDHAPLLLHFKVQD